MNEYTEKIPKEKLKFYNIVYFPYIIILNSPYHIHIQIYSLFQNCINDISTTGEIDIQHLHGSY